jgi:hypothetical protein
VLRAFDEYRRDPWADTTTMGRLFDAAGAISHRNHAMAVAAYKAFDQPFAAGQWDDARRYYRVFLGAAIEQCGPAMLRALADLEPYPHWRENVLQARRDCYSRWKVPTLTADAMRDWKEWESTTPRSLLESSSSH